MDDFDEESLTIGNQSTDFTNQSLQTGKKKRVLTPRVTHRWYRSPEVILKDPEYTQKCDIWSIGCIAYELLFKLQSQDS